MQTSGGHAKLGPAIMLERKIRKRRWRRVLDVSWKSSIASGIIVLVVNSFDQLDRTALKGALIGTFAGFLVPLTLLSIVLMAVPRGFLRRLPYLVSVAVTVTLLLVVSVGALLLLQPLMYPEHPFTMKGLVMAVSIGLVLSLIFTAVSTVQQFLGPSFASDLILGRYHRPREGERLFAFVDLRDSTKLGERLGHRRFFSLINDFLALVEQCAELYDGRIYKYVGDGAIVVWKVDKALAAVRCLQELSDAVASHQARFEQRYDTRIFFTAGLHEGRVLMGEIGDERREIGYLGDPVNTAARIQGHCKELGVSWLLSEAVAERAAGQDAEAIEALHLRRHDGVLLRGRSEPVTLLSPSAADSSP
jgi:adenylate cyclase